MATKKKKDPFKQQTTPGDIFDKTPTPTVPVETPTPTPTQAPTQPAQTDFITQQAQAIFGPNVSESQRLILMDAIARGGGDIKGFGDITEQQAAISETTLEKQKLAEEQAPIAQEELRAAGAFEEVTPQEIELSPEGALGEGIPLIGPTLGAIQSILGDLFPAGKDIGGFEGPITEETIREAALRKIREDRLKEGTTSAEKFGSLVEGIPIVGSLARQYAAGLTQTPSNNANDVIEDIKVLGEDASTGQEKVRNNLQSPSQGLDDAGRMEEQIAELEGRIKALINSSPVLRANTDEVNRIEDAIFKAKKQVSRYKQASAFGYTAELTGTGRIVPTDEQMFFELQEKNK